MHMVCFSAEDPFICDPHLLLTLEANPRTPVYDLIYPVYNLSTGEEGCKTLWERNNDEFYAHFIEFFSLWCVSSGGKCQKN